MNIRKLKGVLVSNGDNQGILAEWMGISQGTLSAKMNEKRGAQFTLSEIKKIIERYNLTDHEVVEIFFS